MSIIPKQMKMSTQIGGFLMLLARTMSFVSIFNFIMITRIQYYNNDDDFIRIIFPHYSWFFSVVVVVTLIAMTIIYVFVIPSEIKFSNYQSVKDERNPLFNLLKEVSEELKEVRKELDELKNSSFERKD